MKLKYIILCGVAFVCLSSCNAFLDKEPQDAVTPNAFFKTDADLAAYTVNLYGLFNTINPGSYGIGPFANDNNTDNQASVGYSNRWVPGEWKVAEKGAGWDFSTIRRCNYFFEKVLPKYNVGEITGAKELVNHYIGEAYVLRAMAYFYKLKEFGDFPIVQTPLPDNEKVLIDSSVRMPSYKVARFIMEDLKKAEALLQEVAPGGKDRISKNVALLLRSRVALYEGTWLKYHKGTAFVPGGKGWEGNPKDIEGFNIDNEINYFLDEAIKDSKVVGDKIVNSLVQNTDTSEGMDASLKSLNPYYTMFCDINMEPYTEVLMWRDFAKDQNVTHNIQMQLERNGGGTGWTRGLVNSFVMRNGLPIYAEGSGYNEDWEKEGISATLQNRDSRICIFTKGDNSVDYYAADGNPVLSSLKWVVIGSGETRMVTGFAIKKGKYYDANMGVDHHIGVTGSIVFRGTEALLNYIEASYEKTNAIDATADVYWKALRTRAKVNPDYNVTIQATNMEQEAKGDFGAYSHGKLINPTLYNIRRERRNEFIGEGFRWDDLKRWRACDQVNGYQIEGMRYWGSVYEGAWTSVNDKKENINLAIVDVDGGKGNISSKEISGVYIRPYQISRVNNLVFEGYKFIPAHYLSPLPQNAFRQTAKGDQTDLNTSVLYQNPGWPKVAGQGPK